MREERELYQVIIMRDCAIAGALGRRPRKRFRSSPVSACESESASERGQMAERAREQERESEGGSEGGAG